MTKEQMAWASQHDWFIADLGNGRALVIEHWVQAGADPGGIVSMGTCGADWLTFDNAQALRSWAGY